MQCQKCNAQLHENSNCCNFCGELLTQTQNVQQPNLNPNMQQPYLNPNMQQPNLNQSMQQPNLNPNMQQHNLNPNMQQPNLNPNMQQPNLNPNMQQPNLNPNVQQHNLNQNMQQHNLNPNMQQHNLNPNMQQPNLNPNVQHPNLNQNMQQPNLNPNVQQPNLNQNWKQLNNNQPKPANQTQKNINTQPKISSTFDYINLKIIIPVVVSVLILIIIIAVLIFGGDFKVRNGVLIEYRGSESVVVLPEKVVRVSSTAFDKVKHEINNIETVDNKFVTFETGVFKKVNEYKDFEITNNIITGYKGSDTFVTIPPFIAGIYEYAFNSNITISTLNIGNHVSYISMGAFSNCSNLKTINIGDSVVNIGALAFANNEKLSNITLSNSIQFIGYEAFAHNINLKSIVLPNSLKYIGESVFNSCVNLSDIQIGNSVSTIGYEAFFNTPWYDSLKDEFAIFGDGVLIKYNGDYNNVKIPTTVKSIYDDIFWDIMAGINLDLEWYIVNDTILMKYNGSSTNPIVPDNIKEIACGAFAFNEYVETVTIPNSVERIGSLAFAFMPKLTTLNIPNNVNYIGGGNLMLCPELIDINIPTNVKEINQLCFTGCDNLSKISIPSNVEFINSDSFKASPKLKEVEAIHSSWISAIKANAQSYEFDYEGLSSNSTPDYFEGTGKIDGVYYNDFGVDIDSARHAVDKFYSGISDLAADYGNGDFIYFVELGELYVTFSDSNYLFHLGPAPKTLREGDFLKLNGDEMIKGIAGLTDDAKKRLSCYGDLLYYRLESYSLQQALSMARGVLGQISSRAFYNEGWLDSGETLDSNGNYFPSFTFIVHGTGSYDVVTHVVHVNVLTGDIYIEDYRY